MGVDIAHAEPLHRIRAEQRQRYRGTAGVGHRPMTQHHQLVQWFAAMVGEHSGGAIDRRRGRLAVAEPVQDGEQRGPGAGIEHDAPIAGDLLSG